MSILCQNAFTKSVSFLYIIFIYIYIGCVKIIDDEMETTINDFTDFFLDDKKTTYIFTSASGSSGILHNFEFSQRPLFLAWGAGMKNDFVNSKNNMMEVNQTSIAPMISTLLDIDFPFYSEGLVPFNILEMNNQNMVKAIVANAMQFHEKNLAYLKYLEPDGDSDDNLIKKTYGGLNSDNIYSIGKKYA